jgi:hypothetical protein
MSVIGMRFRPPEPPELDPLAPVGFPEPLALEPPALVEVVPAPADTPDESPDFAAEHAAAARHKTPTEDRPSPRRVKRSFMAFQTTMAVAARGHRKIVRLTELVLNVMLRAMSAPLSPPRSACAAFLVLSSLAIACSSGPQSVGDNRPIDGGTGGATAAEPTAAALLAVLGSCSEISNGELSRESGRAADVPVCKLSNAVYWRSELAVDCDGKKTTICNSSQDPQYQSSTVGKDSAGDSLDASVVPYVEVPTPGAIFNYHSAGLSMGSVAAVIYKDHLAYGVVGHEQDADVIGAASYAMADALGINPDPVSGGLESEDVTYFAFTGASNVVPALEDQAAVSALAKAAATTLIAAGD